MFTGSLMILISFAVWALAIIIIAFVLYFVVRLAITAALKSHTRWERSGES